MSIEVILSRKGSDVIAIAPSASLREALQLMHEKQIGALMVMGNEAAIFTERDVMRALATNDAECLSEPVSAHMTSRPQVITPQTSIVEAMEIMTEKRFRHLPVMTQQSGGELCGIISIGDLVNHRIRESESQTQALKEYITSG